MFWKTIHEFFAVTKGETSVSVYHVSDEKNMMGFPKVQKIALKGKSDIPVGSRLKNGYRVVISQLGIMLGHLGREHPEHQDLKTWGGHTSPIVALFLKKEDAERCLAEENHGLCDPRWRRETEETLKAIGRMHPVFLLSVVWSINFERGGER